MADAYTGTRSIFQGQAPGQKEMVCDRCKGNFAGDERNRFNDGVRDLSLCDNCIKETGNA